MPVFDPHTNFAYGTILTPPNPALTGNAFTLASGQGTNFTDPATGAYNCVVWPAGQLPTPGNAEVVRATSKTGDVLVCTRTQEGSSGRVIQAGDQFANVSTVKVFTDIENAINMGAPAANQLNVLGQANGDAVSGTKLLLDGTLPGTLAFAQAASAGVSLKGAHVDHGHAMPSNSQVTGLIKEIVKPSDQTVNNSTVLVNDSALFLPLNASEVWYFKCFIAYSDSTGGVPDLKLTFTVPAAATIYWGMTYRDTGDVVQLASVSASATTIAVGTAATIRVINIYGVVVNGANAGNLQLQWAQNTANVSDTKVLANSALSAVRTA